METKYIEKHDVGYWVTGTRVSLDSIVYAFRRGASPETIKLSFPVLTLDQVYGAITFYLARQTEIDEYLGHSEEQYETSRRANNEELRKDNPDLYLYTFDLCQDGVSSDASMKIRFLGDYDFNGEIIDGLLRREPSVDLKSGYEAGLEGVPDPDVLEKADNEGRTSSPTITGRCRNISANFSHVGVVLVYSSFPSSWVSAQQLKSCCSFGLFQSLRNGPIGFSIFRYKKSPAGRNHSPIPTMAA